MLLQENKLRSVIYSPGEKGNSCKDYLTGASCIVPLYVKGDYTGESPRKNKKTKTAPEGVEREKV